jgi:hypothetical protein
MNKLAVITLFFLHVVYFEGAPHISSGGHDLRKEQAIAFPGAEGSDMGKPSILVDKPFEAIGCPAAHIASS